MRLPLIFRSSNAAFSRSDGGGQLFRPFDAGLVRQLGGGGGLGMEIRVQLLLARGKIPDGAFQRVQQREHFLDARITHNRS